MFLAEDSWEEFISLPFPAPRSCPCSLALTSLPPSPSHQRRIETSSSGMTLTSSPASLFHFSGSLPLHWAHPNNPDNLPILRSGDRQPYFHLQALFPFVMAPNTSTVSSDCEHLWDAGGFFCLQNPPVPRAIEIHFYHHWAAREMTEQIGKYQNIEGFSPGRVGSPQVSLSTRDACGLLSFHEESVNTVKLHASIHGRHLQRRFDLRSVTFQARYGFPHGKLETKIT